MSLRVLNLTVLVKVSVFKFFHLPIKGFNEIMHRYK